MSPFLLTVLPQMQSLGNLDTAAAQVLDSFLYFRDGSRQFGLKRFGSGLGRKLHKDFSSMHDIRNVLWDRMRNDARNLPISRARVHIRVFSAKHLILAFLH